MSRAEIISELPKLSHEDRREIMRCIVEAQEDAATLEECGRLALERFKTLDVTEAEDEKTSRSLG